MKLNIILVIFLFTKLHLYSQNIYYGYPVNKNNLKTGDIIIINVPENINGRFTKSVELDKLVEFLYSKPNLNFKIELNIFYGSSMLNMDYSEHLSDNLKEVLEMKTELNNCQFKFNGSKNPIFLDKKSLNYKLFNTRIEILIE